MNRQILINELLLQHNSDASVKDIIIIVHDQYEHVKRCIESIRENTKNYRLFVWDNGSKLQTKEYLLNCKIDVLIRSETNLGFIIPNNTLASLTDSPYLILLNSDTEVSAGWDEAMLGMLQSDHNIGAVGYQGRLLNKYGIGTSVAFGEKIDYIDGWCLCLPRKIYNKFGLFDQQLKFAYYEDSDLCLRIKKENYKLYALHLNYVKHVGGVTSKTVNEEMPYFKIFFEHNQNYFMRKWQEINNGKTKIY
jgi:GT2 family glycosyltransferase